MLLIVIFVFTLSTDFHRSLLFLLIVFPLSFLLSSPSVKQDRKDSVGIKDNPVTPFKILFYLSRFVVFFFFPFFPFLVLKCFCFFCMVCLFSKGCLPLPPPPNFLPLSPPPHLPFPHLCLHLPAILPSFRLFLSHFTILICASFPFFHLMLFVIHLSFSFVILTSSFSTSFRYLLFLCHLSMYL